MLGCWHRGPTPRCWSPRRGTERRMPMETLQTYLPDYFFLALGLLLFLYMATDGYNLGLGIFSLAARREEERSVMIHSIATPRKASPASMSMTGM